MNLFRYFFLLSFVSGTMTNSIFNTCNNLCFLFAAPWSLEMLLIFYLSVILGGLTFIFVVIHQIWYFSKNYSLPGCPFFVGVWVQGRPAAQHVAHLLHRYRALPLRWRPQRIRPRNRQVSVLPVMLLYCVPCRVMPILL